MKEFKYIIGCELLEDSSIFQNKILGQYLFGTSSEVDFIFNTHSLCYTRQNVLITLAKENVYPDEEI